MRCFIAVDLPDEARAALSEARQRLKDVPAKLSLARDFHLTMKFLGEITPAKMEAVKSRLANVKFKAFAARLSKVGFFASGRVVRVVWAGIEPQDEFIELQQLIDEALEGEFPKEKNFKPHLTLARVKLVQDRKGFSESLQKTAVSPAEFTVGSFKLKQSTLGTNGATYDDLAVYNA